MLFLQFWLAEPLFYICYQINFCGIVDFINKLNQNTNTEFISLLLKITGISILTEYAVSICKDSGENAISNKIDLGGKVIVISMSIPVISATLDSLVKLLP